MLISLSYMLLLGMFLGWACKKCHLPALLGMMATGVLLGPYVANLIDESILSISSELRRIALIIILMRAGLSLELKDLKKVGIPAVLMCFIPACLEMIGMILFAPKLLHISILDAAIMGAVIAAVSPAVIVPKMLKLMEEGYGTKQSIPQLILAGASVDDVFVIVIFSVFTGLSKSQSVSAMTFVKIPLSIITGVIVGAVLGYVLSTFFQKVSIRDTAKVILLLCASFILVTLEDAIGSYVPFSGLIAVMFMGIFLQRLRGIVAVRLSAKFNKLWVGAEILLFVLVGTTINPTYVAASGLSAIALIFIVLCFRMFGVWLCMLPTKLTGKERLFCMLAYTPKATVQAAIGGIPLSMGLSCGNIVLTVAVLAIIITAPLGAFLIEHTYRSLLSQ